ncbi:MAG: hypothetical protein FWE53_02150 [Firmicutes bacterium]|nr:hypothetical protein [Bacillota bacterium]
MQDGRVIKKTLTNHTHFVRLQQVTDWLGEVGFEIEKLYGNYSQDPVSENTNRAIIYAKKIKKDKD